MMMMNKMISLIHLLIFPTSSFPNRSFEAARCLPSFDTFLIQMMIMIWMMTIILSPASPSPYFSQMIPKRTLGVMILVTLFKGMRVVIVTSSFCCSTTLATVFVWLSATSTVADCDTVTKAKEEKAKCPLSRVFKKKALQWPRIPSYCS